MPSSLRGRHKLLLNLRVLIFAYRQLNCREKCFRYFPKEKSMSKLENPLTQCVNNNFNHKIASILRVEQPTVLWLHPVSNIGTIK